jgi:lipopolysaccharide export system permease protein
MTVFVLTFVMTIGGIFKLSELISNGVEWQPLVFIMAMSIPQVLSFSIPVSILISVLLVFGRLSSDSEIVAMHSCGVSLRKIAFPIWLCGLILSGVCFLIFDRIVPITHHKTRDIVSQLKNTSADKLIEEGRFIDVSPELSVFVGKRAESGFCDIRIFDTRQGFRREITAKHGSLTNNVETGEITLRLEDVRIDPFKKGNPGAAYCSVLPIPLDTSKTKSRYEPKATDFTSIQLFHKMRNMQKDHPDFSAEKTAAERSQLLVEINSRVTMSLSCLIFAILGIPLGVKSHRKETSAGIAMSLGLILFFYLFMIVADALGKYPYAMPHLVVWLPITVSLWAAARLMHQKK